MIICVQQKNEDHNFDLELTIENFIEILLDLKQGWRLIRHKINKVEAINKTGMKIMVLGILIQIWDT